LVVWLPLFLLLHGNCVRCVPCCAHALLLLVFVVFRQPAVLLCVHGYWGFVFLLSSTLSWCWLSWVSTSWPRLMAMGFMVFLGSNLCWSWFSNSWLWCSSLTLFVTDVWGGDNHSSWWQYVFKSSISCWYSSTEPDKVISSIKALSLYQWSKLGRTIPSISYIQALSWYMSSRRPLRFFLVLVLVTIVRSHLDSSMFCGDEGDCRLR
jgi:hypothetical protein